MENCVIKNCKGCHQPLRIPADIGGMVMRCPSCGYEFHTDFKLGLKARESGNGKEPHKSEHFKDIPVDYLQWLSGKDGLDEDIRFTVGHYLK